MTGSKVERFKKAMKTDGYGNFPPIDAANVEGRLIIIDGHHRAAAAARVGVREVPVNVRNVSAEEASQLMSEAAEAMSRRYRGRYGRVISFCCICDASASPS